MRNTIFWTAFFLLATADASRVAAADTRPAPDADGWIQLFNGKNLDGWDGDPAVWRVNDGCITGRADRIAKNTFLIYRQPLTNFTLRARFKLTEKGRFPNSGIQYRSRVVDAAAHVVAGYQADIGEGHWGDVHEEQGRSMLAKGSDAAAKAVRRGDWNDIEITAVGTLLTHRVNGVVAADFREMDSKRGAAAGVVALQYHQPGDGFEIRFQDVRVKLLDAAGNAIGAGVATRPAAATTPATASTRADVPPTDAQASARKQVRMLFEKDYAAPVATRLALAAKLMSLAAEPKESPANRFVLLSEARDLFAAGGDPKGSIAVVDQIAAAFVVEPLTMKTEALAAAGRSAEDPKIAARVAKVAIPIADDAVRAERYDLAERLLTTAETAARRGVDAVTEGKARRRQTEVRDLTARRERAMAAERVLAQQPDDPAANATAGAYRCFVREDWATGLPLLAKGSDPALASLAVEELRRPKDSQQFLQLADGWWNAAEKLAPTERGAYRRRAAHWYEQARPGLSGLAKTLAEKRIAEFAPSPTVAGPVDLLKLVDVDLDVVNGDWQRAGANLTCNKGQAQRIILPAMPGGSYDLTIRFIRQSGDDAVLIYLPANRSGTWLVLSGWGSKLSALYDVNGKRAAEVAKGALVNGREYRVDVRVAIDGDNADILVRLDGEPYLHWAGRAAALAIDDRWGLPNPRCFALGAVEKTLFTAATARAVSGSVAIVRP